MQDTGPVLLAVSLDRLEFAALLAADLRVDLDDINITGDSLKEYTRWALVAFSPEDDQY